MKSFYERKARIFDVRMARVLDVRIARYSTCAWPGFAGADGAGFQKAHVGHACDVEKVRHWYRERKKARGRQSDEKQCETTVGRTAIIGGRDLFDVDDSRNRDDRQERHGETRRR